MKIIFNSDLLYAKYLIQNELPRHLIDFFNSCKEKHEVVIPLTTFFEFNNKQEGHLNNEIIELQNAIKKLDRYNAINPIPNPSNLVKLPDLISLISNLGISCSIEEPTISDYSIAHRKACSRENPHPPEIESDEMRDLVIWEMSLRIAKENSGAILMSRDKVHVHHRGDKEANENQLIRCVSLERALDSLSIDTASAKKIKQLIDNIRNYIIQSELPVVEGGHVISVKNPLFYDTDKGSSVVICDIEFESGDGKKITSFLKMEYVNDSAFILDFNDIRSTGTKKRNKPVMIENLVIELTPPELSNSEYDSRMNDLKEIMKG